MQQTANLKIMWYLGNEKILLILDFYMFVAKVHKTFFSKFGKW